MESRQVKQVILMRTDLNMRKGKMIAQGAHASMKVLLDSMSKSKKHNSVELWNGMTKHIESNTFELSFESNSVLDVWLNGIFTKICLQVDSEATLLEHYNKAKELGIPCALIEDSGLTEFKGVPTKTCCAIGPYWSEDIDKITGELKLL